MAVGRVGDRPAGDEILPGRRRPSAGPMLRSANPDLVRQELAAWAAATEMTRGTGRDAALAAAPARNGRRAGQPVRPREIPFTATRRAVIAAIAAAGPATPP